MDLIQVYLDELKTYGKSPRTIETYRSHLTQYAAWLFQRKPCQNCRSWVVPRTKALQYLERIAGLKPASRWVKIEAITLFYSWLVDRGSIDANPWPDILKKMKRPGPGKPRSISREDIASLLDSIPPTDPRTKAIVNLLYDTGMRVSEMVKLNIRDLQWDPANGVGTICVKGKGEKERYVNFGQQTLDSFSLYYVWRDKKANGSSALFINDRGGRLSRQSVWTFLKTYGNGTKLHPHVLRHSCLTHMADSPDADVRDVQEYAGHSNLNTTMRYIQKGRTKSIFSKLHPRG